jgi:hypothetical protein
VGIPECETQAIHVIHNAQPSKHHDATFTLYKTKHTVMTITQPIILSHQSNMILLRFSQSLINYAVYTRLIQSENHKHAVDIIHTVFLVAITIRPQKKIIVIMTETPHTQRDMCEQHQEFVTNAKHPNNP